jgi:1-deoxy-D-xylulose-5-phosphate reductoisomerase
VTGSVGTSTVNVIRRNRDRFRISGLSAHSNYAKLARVAQEFGVRKIGIGNREKFTLERAENLFPAGTTFFFGTEGNCELASSVDGDAILMAIPDSEGILPTIAAIRAGKTIMLASKEVLVAAGALVMAEVRSRHSKILPIDSEHNAIFQCLKNEEKSVKRIILTASGGPFRGFTSEKMKSATIEDALNHPTWSMGPKITINSATMVNKAFEKIEAKWLFDIDAEQISILIHPESIVHSLVEFCDGSVLGQLAPPSMEYPISNCLFYPSRERNDAPGLDFERIGKLTFERPDYEMFPCLKLADVCLRDEGNIASIFLSANEVAVEAFLAGKIHYLDIYRVIAETLNAYSGEKERTLDAVLHTLAHAKIVANFFI